MRQLKLENGATFGVAQQIQGARAKEIEALINETERYMREVVHKDPKYAEVKAGCENRNELCSFWALIGECEANPKFMEMVGTESCIGLMQLRCLCESDDPMLFTFTGMRSR